MPTSNGPDELQVEKAEALLHLRLRLQEIKERRWPPWKSGAGQRELQLAVNMYVDRILLARLRAILHSPLLTREFDPEAFVDEVLEETKRSTADPDVERLAGAHREMVVRR